MSLLSNRLLRRHALCGIYFRNNGFMLHDEKPTAVRRCLSALNRAVQRNPQLAALVSTELDRMDASRYAPSMAPLVAQDVAALREQLAYADYIED